MKFRSKERTTVPNSSEKVEKSNEFPSGMRVLIVDDDHATLGIVARMCRKCSYDVTTCDSASFAIEMLRDKKDYFDLVISDVHMPDMDGFKLLEIVGLEMDIPVIMMSADDDRDTVHKGVTHGARSYIIKPVRSEELQVIWQHVVRKQRESSGGSPASDTQSDKKGSKKRTKNKDQEDEDPDSDEGNNNKRPRVVWTPQLHKTFVWAVSQIGVDKAVPKNILDVMNKCPFSFPLPFLTRENVASHLQKYRLYLKKLLDDDRNAAAMQQQNLEYYPQTNQFPGMIQDPVTQMDYQNAYRQVHQQQAYARPSEESIIEQRPVPVVSPVSMGLSGTFHPHHRLVNHNLQNPVFVQQQHSGTGNGINEMLMGANTGINELMMGPSNGINELVTGPIDGEGLLPENGYENGHVNVNGQMGWPDYSGDQGTMGQDFINGLTMDESTADSQTVDFCLFDKQQQQQQHNFEFNLDFDLPQPGSLPGFCERVN